MGWSWIGYKELVVDRPRGWSWIGCKEVVVDWTYGEMVIGVDSFGFGVVMGCVIEGVWGIIGVVKV